MADGTVVVRQTYLSQQIRNVLVFSNIPEDDTGRQTFADVFRTIWGANFPVGTHVDDWSLDGLTFVYNDEPPIFSVPTDFTAGPITGTSTDNPMPPQNCCLASLQKLGTPPNRGRIYYGGFGVGWITASGGWDATLRDRIENHVADLVDGVEYTGGAGVSYLRIGRRDSAGTLTASGSIENVIVRGIVAIQRSRRVGQGD